MSINCSFKILVVLSLGISLNACQPDTETVLEFQKPARNDKIVKVVRKFVTPDQGEETITIDGQTAQLKTEATDTYAYDDQGRIIKSDQMEYRYEPGYLIAKIDGQEFKNLFDAQG